jgi:hypothetical protein
MTMPPELTNVILNMVELAVLGALGFGIKKIIAWQSRMTDAIFGDGTKERPGIISTLAVHAEKLEAHEEDIRSLFDRTNPGYTRGSWDGRNRRK